MKLNRLWGTEMQNQDECKCIDKDAALDILDRTIDFTRNSENKASIFLGIFGVILTIFLSTEGIRSIKSVVHSATIHLTFCNILYLMAFFAFICATIYGLFKMLKVLDVNVETPNDVGLCNDTKIFFEHIRKNQYLDYKNKLLTLSQDEMISEISSQIYINSCICSEKYSNYKIGLRCTVAGFSGFLVLWIIGTIIF